MTSLQRKQLLSGGHLLAWVAALALGIGWVLLLRALRGDLAPMTALIIALTGIFGFGLGLLIATGWLVRVMRLLGNPTRAMSSRVDELPAARAFGIFVMLFCLPSMFVYFMG
jgi:hypothetical protein